MQYKDFVRIAPRFTRAINLERDANVPEAVNGYIVTVTAGDVLTRFARALRDLAGHRAWTLTGPYGSGKSAFALYLANLLGPGKNPSGELARSILRKHSPETFRDLFDQRRTGSLPAQGFCPVLLSGTAEPLLPALLRACSRDIERYCRHGRPPKALEELQKLRTRGDRGKEISPSACVDLLVRVARNLQQSGRSQGVLVVIDELGKFLEFAARQPDKDDIHLLQELAEATAQFRKPGLFLVTILHQAFERYVIGLRPAVRDEWSKVQGRFEDIAFQEPAEEFLNILARAIEHVPRYATSRLRQQARLLGEKADALGLAPRGITRQDFLQLSVRCAPLHPISVLALGRLCRKFGQNQRSLFAFLVSREPHGFASFLAQDLSEDVLPFYHLDRLYDYVAMALGNGLAVGEGATRWAEVQSALDRAADLAEPEIRAIKGVGMLSAIGAYGNLRPSREIVAFASQEGSRATNQAIQKLLTRSILICRKHSHSLGLWQGSDVDIEARLKDAAFRIAESTNVARRLGSLWFGRPLVAKRHSFETGTLRYFAIRFSDVAGFSAALEPDPDADGLLIYCLPGSPAEREDLLALAESSAVRERQDVLIAVPRDINALKEAARELELVRWVEANTPELKGDAVARREVRARVLLAEKRLAAEVQALFSPAESSARTTDWFQRGIRQVVTGSRSLAHVISNICDAVYPYTPRLRNELINRRALSSAAAAARRNLIEAMITRGTEPRLAITGTPPEMSMYVSLLEATGIHRCDSAGCMFGPPQNDENLGEVWNAMEKFFSNCELRRGALSELFSILQKPPFGLKLGIIPVLFCAAALAHDTEVAVYENGGFVPELSVEVFERLLRSAEKFEVRRYRVEGVRRDVFQRFADLLGDAGKSGDANLVAVVRPLYRFFNRLPQYTRQTKALSETAVAVRETLLNAREPDVLLFEELPRSCGFGPFGSATTSGAIAAFFAKFRTALSELQRRYDDLLSELLHLLFGAFHTEGTRVREIIRFRARALENCAVEPRLRAFIHYLYDEQLDDVPWIEAIATLLTGKPPRGWTDADRARYEVMLSELARSFRHIEALSFELADRAKAGLPVGEVLRLGVTDRYSKDLEAVVVVEPNEQATVAEVVIQVEELLDRLGASDRPALALAALATVSRRFLADLDAQVKPNVKEFARE